MNTLPPARGKMNSVALVLVRPRYPENIGAAARIALNYGISELIAVCDQQPDQEKMLKIATHKAADLIRNLKIFPDTRSAVASFHFVVGTTARLGRHRTIEQTPREVMHDIAPLLAGGRIALMFGPENTGLSNEDLDFCQYTSTIPTADFSSLNLAQAVAIHCYELFMALTAYKTTPLPDSDYANSHELEGMYEHIEQALINITFIKETNQAYWMRSIRHFLGRMRLKKKEASLIRGVCRKFLWHQQAHGPASSLPLAGEAGEQTENLSTH